jgi:hypothetical protein
MPPRKTPAKPRTRKPKPPAEVTPEQVELESVYGPFSTTCVVSMTVGRAIELFGPLAGITPLRTLKATERDLAELRKRDKDLADSTLAAVAVSMARELDNPYNSATSKSMCAGKLQDVMDRLRELAPPQKKGDALDDLADRRSARRAARLARAADPPGS